jgi:hypothetical protein
MDTNTENYPNQTHHASPISMQHAACIVVPNKREIHPSIEGEKKEEAKIHDLFHVDRAFCLPNIKKEF